MTGPVNNRKRNKSQDKQSLNWIIKISKPQLPTIIAIIICEAIWAVFGTVTALFSMEIVNSAVAGNKNRMFLYIGIYLAVALSLIGVHAIMRYVTERCKARLEILFKKQVFHSMLIKSYPGLSVHHTGELVNRLTGDVGVISDATTTIIPQVVMMTVRIICAMVVLIRLQWQFAMYFAVAGLVILGAARLLKGKIKKFHAEMQQADGKTRSFWQEIFENLIAIKSFAAEEKSVEKADLLLKAHYKVRMKRSAVSTVSMFFTGFVVRLGHLFAIGYGAFCLYSGTMDYGTLTALIQLVGQVQQPFAHMSGIMPRYYSALTSAQRLMDIEDLENDSLNGERVNAEKVYENMEKIEATAIDFHYDRDNQVLENCSFYINKGDFVSITGMSGIGKSTMFKILLDIYPKSNGDTYIVGHDYKIPLSGLTRTMFAYVPQGNMLLSGTIKESLTFITGSEKITEEKIEKALECACAKDFISELPNGLETVIGENSTGLSEGQAQRIAIARAILSEAPILLFDEATSALDEQTEAKLLENIKNMTDKTCIIVTHRKAALDICNRHFVVENKNIIERQ